MLRISAIFALALTTAVATSAPAWGSGPSASMDLSFYSDEGTVISPTFDLVVPLGSSLALEASWGVSYVNPEGLDSEFDALNPFVALFYSMGLGIAELSVGAGLGIPVIDQGSATGVPLAMQGGWNAWLYLPETFTLAAPARLNFHVPLIHLLAEAALFVTVPTGDEEGDSELNFQLAAEAALPLALIIDLGLRLQMVTLAFEDPRISAEPFAQLNLGPIKTRLGFLMNLDDPNSFSDQGVWAISARAGLSF